MNQKVVWGSKVIILVLLVVGLLSGVILAQRRQDLAGRAYINSTANGRFGVALGTWNYSKMLCFDLDGKPFSSCTQSPIKFNPDNFSDMNFMAYDGSKNQLSKTAFNISAFDRLDPSANTQFIWFHYEDDQGNSLKPANSYLTPDQMWQRNGARIYATSGAPGSVRVIVKKPDETSSNFHLELARPAGQPEIIYKKGYPHCNNCIFQSNDFFRILKSPNFSNFNDGQGNWYAFYLLAETEYPIESHHLSPKRYAAVFNEYVDKMKISGAFPKARFIVQSPVVTSTVDLETRIKPYFNELLGYLTPESKNAISYMGLDAFFGPPPKPDYQVGNWSPVTDEELKAITNDFMAKITPTALFLRNFLATDPKPVLLTQVGSILHGTNYPVAGTISFGGAKCEWCTSNNNDIWSTTQFGHARLIQLIFRELNRRASTGGPIQAWAYWGNARQPYWTEPLIQRTWGDINHGVNWLTWPFLCTPSANCSDTYMPWPTWSGMVYLKLANGDKVWRPQWKNPKTGAVTTAPSWWPTNEVWP